MEDLVIGFAANYDWPAVEPYAVSLVRSGFLGKKVLFVQGLTTEADRNLRGLGFELLPIPQLKMSDPQIALGSFFAYVGRFLLIHQYLFDNPNFRFVVCADTRDVVFQKNPMLWLARNIGDSKIVAAPEYVLHGEQEGNADWVNKGFLEIDKWMLPKMVYCSGFISGYAKYICDLSLAIYMTGRHLSSNMWGADQPAYNMVMHQAPYADVTLIPHMTDRYCLHMVVLAFEQYRKLMTELPPIAAPTNIRIGDYTLPDLSEFHVLHQYDRVPPLANALREKYRL